jgi:DNA-binding IclR family transcriptional regulator
MIGAVDRALSILALFSAQTPELGITEIAKCTGLRKSTVAGLVYTLERNGYLIQNTENRKYRLGFRLAERAAVVLGQIEISQIARPHLEKLRALNDQSVNLGVLDGTEIVCVDHINSTQTVATYSRIGKRLPVHATAMGKAILSELSAEAFASLISRLTIYRYTTRTISDVQTLLSDLDLTRRRGFALDDQESALGLRAVSAPIFDWTGRVIAAVSIAAPIRRFPPELMAQYGDNVHTTAMQISRDMGLMPRKPEQ